jgi:hypothetical protein
MPKRIVQALVIAVLLLGVSGTATAAPAADPVAVVSWVGTQLNAMVDSHIDAFLAEGQSLLVGVLTILMVWYLMIGLFCRSMRNELLIELIMNFMIAQTMLAFYDSPMPWGGGISFHSIFGAEAQWAAGTLDISTVKTVVESVVTMWHNMETPGPLDILGFLTYGLSMIQLAIIWLLCSCITLIGHIALGFGSLMGPLCIPFFIWPAMNWLFWGWVKFMTTYALYIVASSAVVLLYANVMSYFIGHFISGDYSLGNMSALMLPFLVLNGAFIIAFWQCHSWARDLATGSASMGTTVSSMVQAAAVFFL